MTINDEYMDYEDVQWAEAKALHYGNATTDAMVEELDGAVNCPSCEIPMPASYHSGDIHLDCTECGYREKR